jgi:hypothetical protein
MGEISQPARVTIESLRLEESPELQGSLDHCFTLRSQSLIKLLLRQIEMSAVLSHTEEDSGLFKKLSDSRYPVAQRKFRA